MFVEYNASHHKIIIFSAYNVSCIFLLQNELPQTLSTTASKYDPQLRLTWFMDISYPTFYFHQLVVKILT